MRVQRLVRVAEEDSSCRGTTMRHYMRRADTGRDMLQVELFGMLGLPGMQQLDRSDTLQLGQFDTLQLDLLGMLDRLGIVLADTRLFDLSGRPANDMHRTGYMLILVEGNMT